MTEKTTERSKFLLLGIMLIFLAVLSYVYIKPLKTDLLERQYAEKVTQVLSPLVGRENIRVLLNIEKTHSDVLQKRNTYPKELSHTPYAIEKISRNISDKISKITGLVVIDGEQVETPEGRFLYQPRSFAELEFYQHLINSALGLNGTEDSFVQVVSLPLKKDPKFHFEMLLFLLLMGLCVCLFLLWGQKPNLKDKLLLYMDSHFSESLEVLRCWIWENTGYKNCLAISSAQKAAVVLLNLPRAKAKNYLMCFSPPELERLMFALRSLGVVSKSLSHKILTEFMATAKKGMLRGDLPNSLQLLKPLPKKTKQPIINALYKADSKNVWGETEEIPVRILTLFVRQVPVAVAVIVIYHLSVKKAGAVLNNLPAKTCAQIIMQLKKLHHLNGETEKIIRKNLIQFVAQNSDLKNAGLKKIVALLSLSDKAIEKKILSALKQSFPQAKNLWTERKMRLEDICTWPPAAIRQVVSEISLPTLLVALKGSSDSVKRKFIKLFSPAKWKWLAKEINSVTGISIADIEAAQLKIIEVARQQQEGK